MARRRFFVNAVREGVAELCGGEARHLARVLRAEPGQRYEISDGRSAWLAEIDSVGRDRVGFRVIEPVAMRALELPVTLVAALFKFDRFEWLIEKATELGVARIQPAVAERSEKGLAEAAARRLDRWRRIAFESGQQARRLRPPEISEAAPLASCLAAEGACWYLEEEPGAAPLARMGAAGAALVLAIGPEGGWTAGERARFQAAGWTPASLGPLVLRAETAAIAALSVSIHTWWAAESG